MFGIWNSLIVPDRFIIVDCPATFKWSEKGFHFLKFVNKWNKLDGSIAYLIIVIWSKTVYALFWLFNTVQLKFFKSISYENWTNLNRKIDKLAIHYRHRNPFRLSSRISFISMRFFSPLVWSFSFSFRLFFRFVSYLCTNEQKEQIDYVQSRRTSYKHRQQLQKCCVQ